MRHTVEVHHLAVQNSKLVMDLATMVGTCLRCRASRDAAISEVSQSLMLVPASYPRKAVMSSLCSCHLPSN